VTTARKPGRPTLASRDFASIRVQAPAKEIEAWRAAAKRAERTLNGWIRGRLNGKDRTMATYQIETRTKPNAGWTTYGLGEPNEFATAEEAESAIESLRALGDDWAAAEYRVVSR
jgi:hypothetical protein